MISTQRTGLAACCASAVGSRRRCALPPHRRCAKRESRGVEIDACEPRRKPIRGGLHERAVKRRRYRQQQAALGAALRCDRDRALDGFLVAGNHGLLGPVEIDGFHDLRATRLPANGAHRGGVETQDRRHRTDTGGDRFLHRLRANRTSGSASSRRARPRRRARRIRPGCGRQRRRAAAPCRPPGAPDRHASGQHRRAGYSRSG